MDVEKLIYEVKKRRGLWDFDDRKYNDRNISLQLWEEIAEEMGAPTRECKRKWKNLKDTYRAEIKRQRLYAKVEPDAGQRRKSWQYAEAMSFLRNYMAPYPETEDKAENSKNKETAENPENTEDYNSTANQNNNQSTESNSNSIELLDVPFEHVEVSSKEVSPTPDVSTEFNKIDVTRIASRAKKRAERIRLLRARKRRLALDKYVIKREKMDSDKSNTATNVDAEQSFLLSFVPVMKEMDLIQKLRFRAKMCDLALNIMRPESASTSNNSKDNQKTYGKMQKREPSF